MTSTLTHIIDQARSSIWAGTSPERVLLEVLDACEEALGPADAGQRRDMKVVVNAVIPGSPGSVDVHISLRDLKPGQEMSVVQAFSSIESALADGKVTLIEGLSIALALAAIGR